MNAPQPNPYQSPKSPAAAADTHDDGDPTPPQGTYRSARPAARLAIAAMWISALLIPVLAACNVLQWYFVSNQDLARSTAVAGFVTVLIITLAIVLIDLLANVVIAVWMYRACKNIRPLGNLAPGYSPFVAAAVLFIPLINLYRPYFVLRDLWHTSDPEDLRPGYSSDHVRLRGAWSALLAGTIASLLSALIANLAELPVISLMLDIVAYALAFIAMVQLIDVVDEITRRQDARFELAAAFWPDLVKSDDDSVTRWPQRSGEAEPPDSAPAKLPGDRRYHGTGDRGLSMFDSAEE